MANSTTPPADLVGSAPPNGTVDLWTGSVEALLPHRTALRRLLSRHERDRLAGFRNHAAEARYLVAHGALRVLLEHYTGIPGSEARIEYGDRGRPDLEADPSGSRPLSFNLSHSGSHIAIAVAATGPVGVDIETSRPVPRLLQVARRYFHPDEIRLLEDLSDPEEVTTAFLEGWTRKEAYLKAIGVGLSNGLDRVKVSFGPGSGPARLLAIDGDPARAREWRLVGFEFEGGGVVGCVAVPQTPEEGPVLRRADLGSRIVRESLRP